MTAPRITITLSTENVQEAVAQWLNTQGIGGWEPQHVTLSTSEHIEGYGPNEWKVHRPVVRASR